MTVLHDVSEPAEAETAFYGPLEDRAWQHLGLTGEEFKRRWYAGAYREDLRPAVVALDTFMRTGEWLP
jgi:hypothetical protein